MRRPIVGGLSRKCTCSKSSLSSKGQSMATLAISGPTPTKISSLDCEYRSIQRWANRLAQQQQG